MSIATLRIKRPPPALAANGPAGVFRRLRLLQQACGPNKHHQAIALITACIEEGWNTRARIVGALSQLGFDERHAAMTVIKNAGPNPVRHHWQPDEKGVYRLHDDPA